jgi:hypothetical protein
MKILYINSRIYDYLTATLIEGLQELGHEIRCSEDSNYGIKIPDDQIIQYAEKSDLIIVGSNQGVRVDLARDAVNPRKVFVDGSDLQWLNVPDGIEFQAIFKRELNILSENRRVFPLPFAAEKRYFPKIYTNKDIHVSFLANMARSPFRYSVYERLRRLNNPAVVIGSTSECGYDDQSPSPISTPLYSTLLARSIISVNVMGCGYDCARLWEILACRTMLFTQYPDIQIPDPFLDGVHCVMFKSLDEFDDKLRFYITHLELAGEIAQKGYEHLLAYHTTIRRAQYFLETIKNVVNN